MKTVGLIPFNFGGAISEPLSRKMMDFYKWLVTSVIKENCEIQPVDGISNTTLALNLYEYEEEINITFQKIWERFQKWGSNVDIAVFDKTLSLDSFISGPIEVQIAAGIVSLISKDSKPNLYIILVSQLPPPEETIRRMLDQYIREGKVIFVNNEGECLAKDSLVIDTEQYKIKKADVTNNPFDLLRIKMIRRLGHFKKNSPAGKHCVRYFFDGKHCEKELVELLSTYIQTEYHGKSPVILYYKEFSDWLKNPSIAVAQRSGTESFNIRDLFNNGEVIFDESVPPLILFPMIDTGRTCELILSEWNKRGLPKPNIVTVLTTGGVGHNSFFHSTFGNDEYTIKYFLKIERQGHVENCPMCDLGIPSSHFDREDYAMLTTYDIWEMSDKAGWAEEKDVPAFRTGLDLVPDFEKMIHQNGAWLARKITDRLVSNVKYYPAQPLLLVCPDEKGANALAEYLGVIQSLNIIHIPKEVINSCKDGEDISELLKKCEQDTWCLQLSSASKFQPVAIVEEFSVSGKTRQILCTILKQKGLNTLCHFAIFNFTQTAPEDDIESYVLYEIDMPTWEEIRA